MQIHNHSARLFRLAASFGLVVLLAACGNRQVPSPEQSGELVVVTRNSPTTYYTDHEDRPAGFEYDLAAEFAASQGWKLRIIVEEDLPSLLDAVRKGHAHLAAAGLTEAKGRGSQLAFGPAYGKVKVHVVCNPEVMAPRAMPRRLQDMAGMRLEVLPGSGQSEFLQAEARRIPDVQWVEQDAVSADELLERVAVGLTDCAAADSDSLAVAQNFYPQLQAAFVLQEDLSLAWAMRRGLDVGFSRKITRFFHDMHQQGRMDVLRERYFGHVSRLQDADVIGILDRRRQLLPGLMGFLREAEQETGVDWRLLAAMAYQESQWNPNAVSKTGVRGIMMLTRDTAERMGVKNRLDPRESVLGGARYIALLRDGLPTSVPEPDRTWKALAAYNMGLGHLLDARILAKKLGKNPDDWRDMKSVLPLLTRSQHYSALRYGFARGGEARAFVENVRIYYDILKRHEPVEAPAPSGFKFFGWLED